MINFSLNTPHDDAPLLVLIHGLFGDKDNLNNLAKSLLASYNVMSIDLPDHGKSAHTLQWTFDDVVARLKTTFVENSLMPAAIIGHSLGGKVAMAYALTHPNDLDSVIVADIAPVAYTPRHDNVFKALSAVANETITQRKQASDILSSILVEPGTAQFLLKSLKKVDDEWQWQFNFEGLQRDYPVLSEWPYSEKQYTGSIAFIKGERSDYITREHGPAIQAQFPKASYKVISGTGHWLHAEKPALFNRLVLRILDDSLT